MGGSNSHAKFKENLQTLQHLEKIIFDLNKGNIDQTVELSLNYLPEDFPYSYFHVICRVIYSYFVAKGFEKLCIEFIQNMEITTKNKIFDIFSQFLLSINSQESNYLIVNMLENRLIDPKIIQNKNNSYFEQYFLGDKHIKEGLNPLELANIIRNDGIENLQEISSQKNFNFNQSIEPTLYERCSFINKRYVSLIDFAAYFSAVRCFKYLLTKGAIVNETGKYAIAGGNEEIVHLCEQNHSTFEDAYEIAIEFHRNNIFKYFFENKIIEIHNLEKLGEKCILHDNYEIFSFLEENGMKINKNIINDSFITGNTFLFQYFQEKTSISINFYDIPSFCGNEEFFRYFANSGYIDIKSRVLKFYSAFVEMIFCLNILFQIFLNF